MTKPQILPVCIDRPDWPRIGYAVTQDQAERVVKYFLGKNRQSHRNLNVFRRTPLNLEIVGGPDCFTFCFTYCISK